MKADQLSHDEPIQRQILLVEDSIDVRYFAVDVLEGAGHRVTAVSLGEEAIRVATNTEFDIILMDISLPDMTGFEVTRAIRSVESAHRRTRTPIVAFTSHTSQSHRDRASAVGMDGYLTKPILPEVLLAAVGERTRPAFATETLIEDQNIQVSPLVEGYLKRVRDNSKAAAKHLKDGSWEHVVVIGHNLKGTGGTYGFPELSAIGVRLEVAAKDRNKAHAAAILGELETWLSAFKNG